MPNMNRKPQPGTLVCSICIRGRQSSQEQYLHSLVSLGQRVRWGQKSGGLLGGLFQLQ